MSSLSLLVPGLLGRLEFAPAIRGQILPGLDQLFEWAVDSLPAAKQLDQQLIRLLGGQLKHGESASLAYLLGKSHFAVDQASRYLIASPVHLQADSGRLLMHGQDGLAIEPDEVEQWLEELLPIFSHHDIQVYGVSPETWLLCLPESPGLAEAAMFSELSEVIGQDIHDYMPQGSQGMFWRSLINEIQMQLHQSDANTKRQAMGLKAVNSLWIYGAGVAVSFDTTSWDSFYSDDATVRQLAAQAGLTNIGSMASGEDVIDKKSHYRLVVDKRLAESLARGDLDHWYHALQVFDETVATPIVEVLKEGDVKEVQIYPMNGHCYRIRKKRGLAKLIHGFRNKQNFVHNMSRVQ
ncbi:MAG: hypothetical protein COC09_06110 [Gammaproteobacteria bacterium]|nr:hypothetical protein [Gammaproteobacteria bacterium]PCH63378.1 MAG: hypothetical protein COC09_06110 [Gammaproteobacteria bacterium]